MPVTVAAAGVSVSGCSGVPVGLRRLGCILYNMPVEDRPDEFMLCDDEPCIGDTPAADSRR